MTSSDPKTDAQTVARLAAAAVDVKHPEGMAPFAVVPDGYSVEHLEHLMVAPQRKRGQVEVADVTSFNRYFNLHAGSASRIYADPTGPQIHGVLDDHPAGSATDMASWGDHQVIYRPGYSAEWKRWTGADGKAMSQADFARFLEENSIDIVEPAAADVLDTARGLEIRESHNFRQATRLQDGSVQLAYDVEAEGTVKGRDNLRIPSEFTICVPIFFNSVFYKVRCFLRYRKSPQGVAFFYEIHRRDAAELDAFQVILDEVEHGVAGPDDGDQGDTATDEAGRKPFAGTGITPLLGRPPRDRG